MSKYNQIKTIDDFFKRFHYNIKTDLIGNGAFGKVYKAEDVVLHREVAIKVSEVKIIDGREFSLKDEFKALENLGSHPNIANYEYVFTFETQQGIFDYAIIQFYKEGNLDHIIQKNKLSETEKESIALQLLQGIDFLHSNNIIHRDLKPSNILVHIYDKSKVREIIPLITDFGLSKKATNNKNSLINNSFSGGTIGYSSPEQLKNSEIRLNSDLWAYGAIVYEIFTGKQLFAYNNTTDSHKQQMEIYNQIVEHNFYHKLNELPEKWQKVVQACLVRDPKIRVKSAIFILQKLEGKDTIQKPELKILQPDSFDKKGRIEVISPIGEEFEYSIDSKKFFKSLIFENLKIGNYTLTVKNEYNITNKIDFVIKNEGSVVDLVTKTKKSFFQKIDITRYKKPALIVLGTIVSMSALVLVYPYIKPIFEEKPSGSGTKVEPPRDTITSFYAREKNSILNKLQEKDFNQVISLTTSLKKRLPNSKTKMINELDSLKRVAENSLKSESENKRKIDYLKSITIIKADFKKGNYKKVIEIAKGQLTKTPKTAKTEIKELNYYITSSNEWIKKMELENEIDKNKADLNGVLIPGNVGNLIRYYKTGKTDQVGAINSKTYKKIIAPIYNIIISENEFIVCKKQDGTTDLYDLNGNFIKQKK